VGAKEPAVVWHDVNVPDVDSSRVRGRLPIHALSVGRLPTHALSVCHLPIHALSVCHLPIHALSVCHLPIHALSVCHLPTRDCLSAAFLFMFVSLNTRLVLQFWPKWWPTADEGLASIWPLNEWYCNQL
jgi:hypothetical protein